MPFTRGIKKKKPTFKQRAVFNEVIKGSSVSRAMRKVGYAPTTSVQPEKVTKSDGWKQLMEKYLPDKELARVHKEGLRAVIKRQVTKKDEEGKQLTELVAETDYGTRHRYLETAYKIKNRFSDAEKHLHLHLQPEDLELANKALDEAE